MEDVVSIQGLADTGVSVLFVVIFFFAVLKLIPNWINIWKATKESEQKRKDAEHLAMQAYYDERNKTYQQQMDIMNRQSEQQSNLIGQATQVIARSNEVIAGNSEALRQNSSMHEKVVSTLAGELKATEEMSRQMKEHDDRAQIIYTNILRLLDRA